MTVLWDCFPFLVNILLIIPSNPMKYSVVFILSVILSIGLQGCQNKSIDPHRIITLGCCQIMFKNIDQVPFRFHLVSKNEPFPLRLLHVAVDDFVLNPGEYRVVTTLDNLNIAYPAKPLISNLVTPLDVSQVTSYATIRPGMVCEMNANTVALYPGQ